MGPRMSCPLVPSGVFSYSRPLPYPPTQTATPRRALEEHATDFVVASCYRRHFLSLEHLLAKSAMTMAATGAVQPASALAVIEKPDALVRQTNVLRVLVLFSDPLPARSRFVDLKRLLLICGQSCVAHRTLKEKVTPAAVTEDGVTAHASSGKPPRFECIYWCSLCGKDEDDGSTKITPGEFDLPPLQYHRSEREFGTRRSARTLSFRLM